MRPYHVNLGRFTLRGNVVVQKYGRNPRRFRGVVREHFTIVTVMVPTPGPRVGGQPLRPWMLQAPKPTWPDAARCDGHDVAVTATFGAYRNGIGAVAYRASVACADEAEHVMQTFEALAGGNPRPSVMPRPSTSTPSASARPRETR